jgi:type IV pilus assembly protein PilC
MDKFSYKGIAEGKYVEGEIEALNQEEASHKLKEQKIIITNLVKAKKKKGEVKEKGKKGGGFSFTSPFFFLALTKFVIIIFCSLSL